MRSMKSNQFALIVVALAANGTFAATNDAIQNSNTQSSRRPVAARRAAAESYKSEAYRSTSTSEFALEQSPSP